MKIAFTTKGTHWQSMIDPRFGRTDYIGLYDEEGDILDLQNRIKILERTVKAMSKRLV